MFFLQHPLHLACSLACVRIPVNISPSQQARDVGLMRLAAGLIGAEAVEWLELTITQSASASSRDCSPYAKPTYNHLQNIHRDRYL